MTLCGESENSWRVGEIGEKRIIAEVIRPLFDSSDECGYLGDDAAVLAIREGSDLLLSTDRVPADLTAFRLGLIDYEDLGKYLACLNISDIAACGGEPRWLLLNLGVVEDLLVRDLASICRGVKEAAALYGCRVVGGDISSASELSLTATSVGLVPSGAALRRSGARRGDYVFVSRDIGLTPAAFCYFLDLKGPEELSYLEPVFRSQFTSMFPLVETGRMLRQSGLCTSCMDNTDGLAQTLSELAAESGVAIRLDAERLTIREEVSVVAQALNRDPVTLALGAGADFSLVGTVSDKAATRTCRGPHSTGLAVIGQVEDGSGLLLCDSNGTKELDIKGWDYFVSEPTL